jgi:isopentenyl diphosphate isomerase/L-lactate dehydrogenase-like FMN-dependent dehydrogenase
MFDSGVRGAADVFKALALGAKFVFVGRLWVWGLGIKGEIGVRHVMKGLLADFDILMNVAGFQSVDQITKEHIDSSPISASMIAEKSKL